MNLKQELSGLVSTVAAETICEEHWSSFYWSSSNLVLVLVPIQVNNHCSTSFKELPILHISMKWFSCLRWGTIYIWLCKFHLNSLDYNTHSWAAFVIHNVWSPRPLLCYVSFFSLTSSINPNCLVMQIKILRDVMVILWDWKSKRNTLLHRALHSPTCSSWETVKSLSDF